MNAALEEIKHCIDDKRSFCFNSGAGSGKTYSLVQTVNYILKKYADNLKAANQKIMIITFTNAAANEIINRIGPTKLLDVSTIHTRMWELIKRFQSDLLCIHLDKIKSTIAELNEKITQSTFYNDTTLKSHISDKNFQDQFYQYRTLKAADFKVVFAKYTSSGNISNVKVFTEFVNFSIRLLKLENAVKNINDKASGYTKVEYDPFDNYDHLYRMRFSHDTLIEYSNILIKRNRTLKKIIVDTYPFVLVDEFQDTNPLIISLLESINCFSNNSCVVGYYGDAFQNIYGDGIGSKLNEYHEGLHSINNSVNRRSAKKIVNLANRIRKDSFEQIPYLNAEGECQVYYCESDETDSFINEMIAKSPQDEEIHCLVLKNDIVAERTGFGEFYKQLTATKYYRENYSQIATEILNDDIRKLGKVPFLIYKWINLYINIHDSNLPVSKYIPKNVYSNINGFNFKVLRAMMFEVQCDNLSDYIIKMFELAKEHGEIAKILKENLVDIFSFELLRLKGYLLDSLFSGINDENRQEALTAIESILNIDFKVMLNWYYFIQRKTLTNISFHTIHGTKGLEYKNVIIVLTNEFNKKKDYFHSYFENCNNEIAYEDEDFISKRNLLYVAVTRAKESVRLLYIDPNFSLVKDNFDSIFGASQKWH